MKAPNLCLLCKGGRALCGQNPCPLMGKINVKPKVGEIPRDFFGPSMNVFVGRMGYPKVAAGPLAAAETRPGLDSPGTWFGGDYQNIIEMRSLMIRSKQRKDVFSRDNFVQDMQLLALSSAPADTEMRFRKRPVYEPSFSDVTQPMGPAAYLERMRITENVKISRRVDRVASDELRAGQASGLLYKKAGQDVYKITTILTSGALGLGDSRKMVPTRWGITAVDDIIFNTLAKEVREFPSVNDFQVFESYYLDNHFLILLMPGSWEYENFEAWAPGSIWTSNLKKPEIIEEYEPYGGRSSYAELQGGGYYAARLGVIEGLNAMGRQARVVVFREIYEGYVIPLGVWVVRETVRNAFRRKPERFSSIEEALKHAGSRLRLAMGEYKKKSRVLSQRRLVDFQ